MKTLTNAEIITIIAHCGITDDEYHQWCSTKFCPLFKECLHFFTGKKCDSALENDESVEEE